MNPLERRAVALLASIYALRMAGLFLILPVFALFAAGLEGQTPFLIGIAIGAYGLTQAILQIPYGMLSDHLGRKPVIAAGLLVFALGSLIAANADSIWMVIAGRAAQGAGAIAAAIMALVSDLTREEQRTKAMAIIGMTIGASFVVSLILGPVLDGLIGVPGIFWMTGILAFVGIGIILFAVPTPVRIERVRSRNLREEFLKILRDGQLLRLDAGIFVLHLVMTAMFVVLPQAIVQYLNLEAAKHWELYLPVMLAGFAAMIPFLILANRRRGVTRATLGGSVGVLILAQLTIYFLHHTVIGLISGLWLFFAAFSLLEAMLPSLVSRLAPGESKGAAIGVYSSSQFLGAFAGGALGGLLSGLYGAGGVFLLAAGVLGVWLLLIVSMREPRLLATRELRVGVQTAAQAEKLARKLAAVPGVAEAIVIAEEGVAYLKVDPHALDKKRLESFSVS
jgi:MFS family permease